MTTFCINITCSITTRFVFLVGNNLFIIKISYCTNILFYRENWMITVPYCIRDRIQKPYRIQDRLFIRSLFRHRLRPHNNSLICRNILARLPIDTDVSSSSSTFTWHFRQRTLANKYVVSSSLKTRRVHFASQTQLINQFSERNRIIFKIMSILKTNHQILVF